MAVGAPSGRVLALVLRDGLSRALAGVALGLPLALALSRSLEGMLFGVAPWDPGTLGFVSVGIAAAATLACAVPALRATRISPMVALRRD
ncbi:MAG TPA: FtsX-like permease family protein [Vicinamibacteria bacterium]|nr:FtsX-like permease family protein [Vicinamibacteria bacterium]